MLRSPSIDLVAFSTGHTLRLKDNHVRPEGLSAIAAVSSRERRLQSLNEVATVAISRPVNTVYLYAVDDRHPDAKIALVLASQMRRVGKFFLVYGYRLRSALGKKKALFSKRIDLTSNSALLIGEADHEGESFETLLAQVPSLTEGQLESWCRRSRSAGRNPRRCVFWRPPGVPRSAGTATANRSLRTAIAGVYTATAAAPEASPSTPRRARRWLGFTPKSSASSRAGASPRAWPCGRLPPSTQSE